MVVEAQYVVSRQNEGRVEVAAEGADRYQMSIGLSSGERGQRLAERLTLLSAAAGEAVTSGTEDSGTRLVAETSWDSDRQWSLAETESSWNCRQPQCPVS